MDEWFPCQIYACDEWFVDRVFVASLVVFALEALRYLPPKKMKKSYMALPTQSTRASFFFTDGPD